MASPSLDPISRVPYDVLTEIFVHCLPQRRLHHRQPNTAIAPILLCHVCSTWRTVALATASLWSHLSCRLTVAGERSRLHRGNWIVRKKEYEFLLWWKNNQRSMAPSICLDLRNRETAISKPVLASQFELDQVGMIFLFNYISSAKYLETSELFWFIVGRRIESGHPIIYPDPHTLVVSNGLQYLHYVYLDQVALHPNHSPSALRHLYLNGEMHLLPPFEIPTHWSSLTHFALLIPEMPLNYWYMLIRAVPQLQFGHFHIEVLKDDEYTAPTPYTLAQLSTLSISVDITSHNSFPLAILVTALHLPALRDLSLSSEEAWYDHHALNHIYTVLDAAPAITTLTLGLSFLTLHKDEEYLMQTLPRIKDTAPIWRHAPHLGHLHLVAEGPSGQAPWHTEKCRDAFVRNLFHCDSHWLDLNDASCPIRSITVINRQPSHPRTDRIADYTRSRIREYVERSPDVKAVFDVIFETQDQAIGGAWNEWGPNLK